MGSKWTTQVIINGEYEFVEDLSIKQIKELQRLLNKYKRGENYGRHS